MSNSLNRVEIIGNVTKDIEIKMLQSGKSVATVGVATNRSIKRGDTYQDVPEFHTIILWGRMAETAGKYLKKGHKVRFEGRIQTTFWQDKEGGKHSKTEIIAEDMLLLNPLPKSNLVEKAQQTFPESTVDDSPFN